MPCGILSTKAHTNTLTLTPSQYSTGYWSTGYRVRENMAVDKDEVTILLLVLSIVAGLYLFMLFLGLTLHAWQPKDSQSSSASWGQVFFVL